MQQKQKLSSWFSFPRFRESSQVLEASSNSHARLLGLIRGKRLICAFAIERGAAPFLRTAQHVEGYGYRRLSDLPSV